ncbi:MULTISPECIES: MerR family transcriptional regulator [unclassified Paenibacillus]|uniref:MerR family transcriptional regulator n=1 Tax=unclassified Paenibacillus TaxID=185978 RepID=UPI00070BC161|nr:MULTISPECIES: MerR family transcriptional regulator [unclassified Paenibacillus]KQX49249.1 MerR family transcriptional regulator [Paenibacillus sp. Root444D2]KRE36737.1 MerR family transcriptional regulator [Paenibacillus sp. Soil724D2]
MEKLLTIRQVADITGLSVHTLRYYENIGLLSSIHRNKNGYRCYSKVDIIWIEFLNRLKATGMPINKMLEIAELRWRGDSTLTERRILLEEHYKEVQLHMIELNQNLNLLADKIVTYKEMEKNYMLNITE